MFGYRKHARLVWCSTIFWFFQNLQCWYFSNAPLLFLLKELIFVNYIFSGCDTDPETCFSKNGAISSLHLNNLRWFCILRLARSRTFSH